MQSCIGEEIKPLGDDELERKQVGEEIYAADEEEIAVLEDDELEEKQVKAEKYAAEPERVTPLYLEFEMKSTHGNRLITYDESKWSCSCDFFQRYETCSHVMTVGRVLKVLPLVQPRGNLEDTCKEV